MTAGFLPRVLASAALFDGAFYVVLTAIPLKAVSLEASAVELGLLPIFSGGVYVLSALLFGHLSDRFPRDAMARAGAVLRALVIVGLVYADDMRSIFVLMPGLGVANGLFWPGVQGGLGLVVREELLSRTVSWFNMAWSSGKMLGFVSGGILTDRGGFSLPLWVAAAATILVALLVPGEIAEARREGAESEPGGETAPGGEPEPGGETAPDGEPEPGGETVPDGEPAPDGETAPDVPAEGVGPPAALSRPGLWRTVGWVANSILFGVGATLNFQYPKFMVSQGMSGTDFGVFLGLVYCFQTVFFVLLGRWSGWHHRLGPLILSQAIALVCLGILVFAPGRWVVWSLAPGVGLALGVSYSASLYYSLHRRSGLGRSSGYHEALLGAGTLVLPFLGGLAVQVSGELWAPYPLLGVILALLISWEILLGPRLRRPAPVRRYPR